VNVIDLLSNNGISIFVSCEKIKHVEIMSQEVKKLILFASQH